MDVQTSSSVNDLQVEQTFQRPTNYLSPLFISANDSDKLEHESVEGNAKLPNVAVMKDA